MKTYLIALVLGVGLLGQTRLRQDQLGPTPAMVILEWSNCEGKDPAGTWDCHGMSFLRTRTSTGEKRYILIEEKDNFNPKNHGDWHDQPVTVLGGTKLSCSQVAP